MAVPISSQRVILSWSNCSSVELGLSCRVVTAPGGEGSEVAKGIGVAISEGEGGVIVIVGMAGAGRGGMMTWKGGTRRLDGGEDDDGVKGDDDFGRSTGTLGPSRSAIRSHRRIRSVMDLSSFSSCWAIPIRVDTGAPINEQKQDRV